MTRHALALLLILTPAVFLPACQDGTGPAPFVENLDITLCAPANGPFTTTIDNPYMPLVSGTQFVFQGTDGGDAVQLVITVLAATEVVAGVTTRVLEERESVNGALIEVSRNFFVQAPGGSVCYFGEDVDIYQGGVVVSHEGQWRAGLNGAVPGIFMPASPAVGMAFRQEVAPGVAEDRVQIVAAGESVTVPYGTFTNTIRFRETTPLEPGASSTKVYARDFGQIVDDHVRLTSRTP
ncbi:MAG: hypothetical protein ACREL9_11315 [Gemmatimonadales bacterium]